MGKTAKKVGRPTKAPKAGMRVPLGLRVTPEMKHKIDAAAERSGRSQSQEAELRLERSFREDEVIGGPEIKDLAHTMTALFAFVARREAIANGHKEWTPKDWIADQVCYQAATVEVCRTLLLGLPKPSAENIAETLDDLKRFLAIELNRRGENVGGSGFVKPQDR